MAAQTEQVTRERAFAGQLRVNQPATVDATVQCAVAKALGSLDFDSDKHVLFLKTSEI